MQKKPNKYLTMIGIFVILLAVFSFLSGFIIQNYPTPDIHTIPTELITIISLSFMILGIIQLVNSGYLFKKGPGAYTITEIILVVDMVLRAFTLLYGFAMGVFFLLSLMLVVSQTTVLNKIG